MQDNMKRNNMDIMGIPEGEEEEQGIENLFENVMMENFPNLIGKKSQNSRKHRVPSKRKPKRPTSRHIIIKMTNSKAKRES